MADPNRSLDGQAAIVTGASRGIGAATAMELAEAGAAVMLTARDRQGCADIARLIVERGGRAEAAGCDVADFAQVDGLVEQTMDAFGRIDILINNAGVIDPIGPLAASDPAAWADNVTINLLGVYHGIRAALPRFAALGGGVIVNVSSGAAHSPVEGWGAYCASKAGVAMLTRQCALEAGEQGVRVYGFAPGTVESRMQEKIRAAGYGGPARMRPEEHGPAEHPARIMAWLCGPEATDLAGQELSVRDPELRRRAGV